MISVEVTETIDLSYLVTRLDDLSGLMREIGYTGEQLVLENFIESRDSYGDAWEAIQPRKDGSAIPLRDTGRLMASITHQSDAMSALVGTNTEYAAIHQLGLGVTARPFLPDSGLPSSWEVEFRLIIQRYLEQ